MPKSPPLRSCVACRQGREKKELLRFVAAPDGAILPDLQQKLPGRGAYTCYNAGCLLRAVKRRQLSRALECEGAADPEALVAQIKGMLEERIAGYISLANKGGKVVSGADRVLEQLKKGTVGIVFLASDLSADSEEKFRAIAKLKGVKVSALFDKERLGALIGKEFRGTVAILESGFIGPMTLEMEKYRNFFEEERE